MEIYEHLNVEECHLKSAEAGRAAHMIRNYLQGFTGLNHPEFACLDALSAKIEANLRAFRAKMRKQKNLKSKLQKISKGTRFIQKIVSVGQLDDDSLGAKALAKVRALADELAKLVVALDKEVNAAAIKKFCNDFNAKLPNFSVDPKADCNIMERYCPALSKEQLKLDARPNDPERASQFRQLACLMSNTAHQTQDAVAEFTGPGAERQSANRVIHLAGQIENKARAMIKVLNKNTERRANKINRKLAKVAENVALLKQMIGNPSFSIPQKKDLLLGKCEDQMRNLELARAVAISLA